VIRTVTIGDHEIETDGDILVVILPDSGIKTALLKLLKRNKSMKEGRNYLIEEGE